MVFSIHCSWLSLSKQREGKEMKEEEEEKGSLVEASKIIQVSKNPNSTCKCVFVLVWSWICPMKRAKNETFMFKLDALRLGEGQVSSFKLLSLRLGEGPSCLGEHKIVL